MPEGNPKLDNAERAKYLKSLPLAELIREIGGIGCEISCQLNGGSFGLVGMDISPIEFLCQAEEDFLQGGLSASINCITNAKRAIVGQIDQILISLGYESHRWDTERKLNKLKELGVLAPMVLRKLVDARNLLEHEYKSPSKEQVEDYLDIAAIFVLGAAAQFQPFSDEITISFSKGTALAGDLDFAIERHEGKVVYSCYGYAHREAQKRTLIGESTVGNNSKLFCALIKACSLTALGYKSQDAQAKLIQKIRSAMD